MGFWHDLFEAVTPQGHQRRYDAAYEKLTGARPMKAVGAPTYHLYHFVIRKHEDTATVHLHGERKTLLGRHDKRIEYITVGFLPGESDTDLVRCAAWMSPCNWRISFGRNMTQFGGKFNAPLEEYLQATLTDPSHISVSN